jgi:hypothetical protein
VVVVSNVLLLGAGDCVMVLKQSHHFLKTVGVPPAISHNFQLPGDLEVSGGLSDVPLGSRATNEVACMFRSSWVDIIMGLVPRDTRGG